MNMIPLFDTLDRCVPFKVRRSLPYLKATEVLAVILTDADGNSREWLELVIAAAVIFAASMLILRSLLTV